MFDDDNQLFDKDEHIKEMPNDSGGEWGARYLNPLYSSAVIAHDMESPTCISPDELASGMEKLAKAIDGNDMQAVQEILLPQAIALQVIFEKAAMQMMRAGVFGGLNAWSNIAFKAQEQSRKTLATLMAIRHSCKMGE